MLTPGLHLKSHPFYKLNYGHGEIRVTYAVTLRLCRTVPVGNSSLLGYLQPVMKDASFWLEGVSFFSFF